MEVARPKSSSRSRLVSLVMLVVLTMLLRRARPRVTSSRGLAGWSKLVPPLLEEGAALALGSAPLLPEALPCRQQCCLGVSSRREAKLSFNSRRGTL